MSKYDKSQYNWHNHCISIAEAEIIHKKQFSWWRKLLGIKPKVYWICIDSETGMLFKEFAVLDRSLNADFTKYSYTYLPNSEREKRIPIEDVIGPFSTFEEAWDFSVYVAIDTNRDTNHLWLQG